MKKKLSQVKKVALLDWMIVLCVAFLLYVPIANNVVWDEEVRNRNDRRDRMKAIVAAENFYYELMGEYTTDISELVFIVESTLDSLITNPNFTGEQIINRNQIVLKNTELNLEIGDLIRVPYDNYSLNPLDTNECFIDIPNSFRDCEKFIDSNKNGKWDDAEQFVDGNGKWDAAEKFIDGNGEYDEGESFIDSNGNNEYDHGDWYEDINGNGIYDAPENYTDLNNNGKYDYAEEFSDCGYDGVCKNKEICKDLFCSEIDIIPNPNWSSADFGEADGIFNYEDVNGNGKHDPDEISELFADIKVKKGRKYLHNKKYDASEEFEDVNKNNKWDSGDYFFDVNGNGEYDAPESFVDEKNGRYDAGESFIDLNNNGIWDDAEKFVDSNKNNQYDEGEEFRDGNGVYDIGEEFIDSNGNGLWDAAESFNDVNNNREYDVCETYFDAADGEYTEGEEFIDGNGKYDKGEEFIDGKNGIWDEGEEFVDEKNGIWDEDEQFIDGNRKYDEGEEFIDGNGRWDRGEDFTDKGNGVYDRNEKFDDEKNGIWDKGEKFIDVKNGIYDEGEQFIEPKNNQYDLGDLFEDEKNGIWDEGEFFIDRLNGRYDEGEDFEDCNENGVYDQGEYFTDRLDGIYNIQDGFIPAEEFIDGNLVWDEGENYQEGNGLFDDDDSCICIKNEDDIFEIPSGCVECYIDSKNGIYDEGEEFTDAFNGRWDEGEIFYDEGNGRYDEGEDFVDLKNGVYDGSNRCLCEELDGVLVVPPRCPDCYIDEKNGVWDEDEEFVDGNGKYDEGEEFTDGNGIWDKGEEFIDEKNGIWDRGEDFIDSLGNGQYDFGEEFVDEKNTFYDSIYELKGFYDVEQAQCISPVLEITSIYNNVVTFKNYEKELIDLNNDGEEDINKANCEILHDINFLSFEAIKSIDKKLYNVNIPLGIEVRIDTTFSELVEVPIPVQDVVYEIEVPNEDNKDIRDKIWTNRDNINNFDYINIIQQIAEDRIDVQKNYLLKKYHLSEDIIYCPISDDNKEKEFILEIADIPKSDLKKFIIKAPITSNDNTYKYGVRYIPGEAEVIVDGIPNWTN